MTSPEWVWAVYGATLAAIVAGPWTLLTILDFFETKKANHG
jgi:hypothetical protein